MLFILRKIRKTFMEKNKLSSYLLYAIGEIVLVVVGILIAVQIDNWNDDRLQQIGEQKLLRNLRNDLQADWVQLDSMIQVSGRKIAAAKNIKKRADQDSVGSLYDFSNMMMALIFVDEFKPNQNTYNEMVNSGNLSKLKNEELKLRLMGLNRTYEIIDGLQAHVRNDFNTFLVTFEEYIEWGSYYNLRKSNIPQIVVYDSVRIEKNKRQMEMDALQLLDDKVFLNNIFLIEVNFNYYLNLAKETKSEIQQIISVIDKGL